MALTHNMSDGNWERGEERTSDPPREAGGVSPASRAGAETYFHKCYRTILVWRVIAPEVLNSHFVPPEIIRQHHGTVAVSERR